MSLAADPVSFFSSFQSTYYYGLDNGSAYWALNNYHNGTSDYTPNRSNFWTQVETIEATEDFVQYYGTSEFGGPGAISDLLTGLNDVVAKDPDFASWDIYNDDIMWSIIAMIRGYEITGEPGFLDQARQQFDITYARAWDSNLSGGLWWTTENQTKNACVNGPGSIAAQLLANHNQGSDYHDKAVAMYTWLRDTLFNDTTGAIYDHIDTNETLATFSFTYNQGTFIGAATLLAATADTSFDYLSDASLAVNFTRTSLTHAHNSTILEDEANDPNDGDLPGFKGIFTRWVALYVETSGDLDARDFLIANANQVWSVRNAQGITWTDWGIQTPDAGPDTVLDSWGASSALSAVIAAARVSGVT